MTPKEYAQIRSSIGTQEYVGRLLGRSKSVISRRESGAIPIDRESELAIKFLALAQSELRPEK